MATRKNTITQISNELELGLLNRTAGEIIRHDTRLPQGRRLGLVHEVNRRHVFEMNISKKPGLASLNAAGERDVRSAIRLAAANGSDGKVYGGGAVLNNTQGLIPAPYRTTTISAAFGRAMLGVKSQQIVIGVANEDDAFKVNELTRLMGPVILAISASSPFRFEGKNLVNTGLNSIRMEEYARGCARFPSSMWNTPSNMNSLAEYNRELASASRELRRRLDEGEMDATPEFFTQKGSDGRLFSDFSVLSPHQIFWQVRVRPDHANSECAMSIEVRMPDMPFSMAEVQTINRFVYGLACAAVLSVYAVNVPLSLDGSFAQLQEAGANGLDARIGHQDMRQLVTWGRDTAESGLDLAGLRSEAVLLRKGIDEILAQGNGAQRMLRVMGKDPTPQRLRDAAVKILQRGWENA